MSIKFCKYISLFLVLATPVTSMKVGSGFKVVAGLATGTRYSHMQTIEATEAKTGQAQSGYQTIDETNGHHCFIPSFGLNLSADFNTFSIGAEAYVAGDFLEGSDTKERALSNGAPTDENSDDKVRAKTDRTFMAGLLIMPGFYFGNGSLFKPILGVECAKWNFDLEVYNVNTEGEYGYLVHDSTPGNKSYLHVNTTNGRVVTAAVSDDVKELATKKAKGDDSSYIFALVTGVEIVVPVTKGLDIGLRGLYRHYHGNNTVAVWAYDEDDKETKARILNDRATHRGLDFGLQLYVTL